jgi:hypothetical protein
MPASQMGALLLRAWSETDDPAGVRARIYVLREINSSEQTMYVAAGIDNITASVRSWLESLVQQPLS